MDGTQAGSGGRSLGVSSGEFRAVQRDIFDGIAAPAAPAATTETAVQPNLHYVFDDPNDGEPGRDRLVVHVLWELVLAASLVGAGFALAAAQPGAFRGDSLRTLALLAALVGLLAVASAVSLRAAVPNLAVGALGLFAAAWVAENASGSWGGATAAAVGLCAAIGLVQGLVVVGLHVPAWAASIGAALAVLGWVTTRDGASSVVGYDPVPDAYLWLVGVMAASVVASVVGAAGGLRRGFGRYRPVADPARRRPRTAAIIAVAVTVASSVIAGLAGALYAAGPEVPADLSRGGLEVFVIFTALGLGAALLGGTSAYGRRGGIFGTVLATCLVAVALQWVDAERPDWPVYGVLAAAIGIGLAVTRLVERFGRPVLLPPDEDESWMPRVPSPATTSTPWRTPAGGLWSSDEVWGNPR